jgi:hypothetical protein
LLKVDIQTAREKKNVGIVIPREKLFHGLAIDRAKLCLFFYLLDCIKLKIPLSMIYVGWPHLEFLPQLSEYFCKDSHQNYRVWKKGPSGII